MKNFGCSDEFVGVHGRRSEIVTPEFFSRMISCPCPPPRRVGEPCRPDPSAQLEVGGALDAYDAEMSGKLRRRCQGELS
jgi:hypothetical protein